MDLTKLNRIAATPVLPTKRLVELVKGETYLVVDVKKVDTQYGEKVLAVINHEYQIYFPKRLSAVLLENTYLLNDLIKKAHKCKLYIMYLGENKFEFITK